ncbi:hypothetical protein HYH03_016336 [Edaphochlamys debaryana]|uniref:Uncharacterized protein n=1 Tax=Edaphochlamys debaryana TaxID=47281 RepID=A0A835XIT3_9CHLO|nr:hypothetical protein HYH03_016336 [Edaphochlamys debaryana]|eukprot:KAG2484848.1 hypothetical protein HYH03_016336 [Edaphochlamys debaryana]
MKRGTARPPPHRRPPPRRSPPAKTTWPESKEPPSDDDVPGGDPSGPCETCYTCDACVTWRVTKDNAPVDWFADAGNCAAAKQMLRYLWDAGRYRPDGNSYIYRNFDTDTCDGATITTCGTTISLREEVPLFGDKLLGASIDAILEQVPYMKQYGTPVDLCSDPSLAGATLSLESSNADCVNVQRTVATAACPAPVLLSKEPPSDDDVPSDMSPAEEPAEEEEPSPSPSPSPAWDLSEFEDPDDKGEGDLNISDERSEG